MTRRMTHYYEKLDDNEKRREAPLNDYDGKITGHIVYGVEQWFDENPEERKRLGWIKHITKDTKDIEYNKQTQYLTKTVKRIDEYTVEDAYYVMDKSDEQMRLEETILRDYDWDDDVVTIHVG